MPDVRSTLERARSNFPAPEMPLEDVLRRRDHRRRNQRIAAGVIGIVVVLAAAAGGATLLRSDPRPAEPPPALDPILREGEVLQTVDINGPDGRIEAVDPASGAARTLASCVDPCSVIGRFAPSPDGRWLAYDVLTCVGTSPCEPEAGIWVTNAAGDHRQLTSPCPQLDRCVVETWTWSAQGATLLVTDGDEVFAVDPFDGSRTPLGSGRKVSALASSPDGSLVTFGDRSSVWTVPTSGGAVTHVADVGGNVGTIDWAPDANRLAVDVSARGRAWVATVDMADGSLTTLAEGPIAQGPGMPAWSPDGSRIAYVSTPGKPAEFVLEVWVANADGSSPVRVYRGACCTDGSSGPVWSPNGNRIAFDDGFPWFVVPADGSGPAEPFTADQAAAWRTS